jgi:hypothetical protein
LGVVLDVDPNEVQLVEEDGRIIFLQCSINIVYNITKNKQFIAIAVTIHPLKKAVNSFNMSIPDKRLKKDGTAYNILDIVLALPPVCKMQSD